MDYNNPFTVAQTQQVLAGLSSPPILPNCISGFIAKINATTHGVDVSFSVSSIVGVSAVTLLRNFVQDIGTATVLNTWSAPQQTGYVWSDTDATLQSTGQAFYWLMLSPTGSSGTPLNVGPQSVVLNPDLTAPSLAFGISASHAAATNGTVLVTINVSGGPSSGTIKVYVSGYQGNASLVAVAQAVSSPIQFALQATDEAVTFTAATVSTGGIEEGGGPTTMLTLDSGTTVPASPQGVTVAAITSGSQISWPSNVDGVTSYDIYRGLRGGIFSAATLLVNVPATANKIMQYLDAGGASGDYGYFVVANNIAGSSAPSAGTSTMLIPATEVSGLGDLAFVDQANTINIVAGAVNTNIVYSSTVQIEAPPGTTIIAQATIVTDGGYVKVRTTMQLVGGSAGHPPFPNIRILKGGLGGSVMAFSGNVFVPGDLTDGGLSCLTTESVDASPASSQQYTVTIECPSLQVFCDGIILVLENAKV